MPALPTAREVVKRTLKNLRRIGSPEQQREAAELEQLLDATQPAEAVSFARQEGEPPAPQGQPAGT